MMDSVVHIVRVEGKDLRLNSLWTNESRRRWLQIGSPLILLFGWQLADMLNILNATFIPAPTTVLAAMVQDATNGQLWSDLSISLYRIALGFVLGVIPGVLIGLSSGLFPVVRLFVNPVVSATYAIPKLALAPLFMLIFGLTETEKILLIAAGTIFPVVINVTAGVMSLDKRYMEVAKNFGASRLSYYRTVALPGSLPSLFSGLKLSLAEALLLIVAAEMIGAQSGIGYRIWMAYDEMAMPLMFVSFFIMSLLGYVFSAILDELEIRIIPWNRKL